MKEQYFKFRKSFGKLVEQMTDKQAGEFIKAVCGYVFLHKPMESKDDFLKGVYIHVKDALDTEARDRENGKLGGAIVAQKYKEMHSSFTSEETSVSETNVVSQLIIVSQGDESAANTETKSQAATDKAAAQNEAKTPKKRGRRSNALNAYKSAVMDNMTTDKKAK